MAVAFGTVSTEVINSGSSSFPAVSKPASTASGDLLLIFWEDDDQGTASLAGWTAAGRAVANAHAGGFLWRIADGSEGATFSLAGRGGTSFADVCCIRYTGTHQTTPINANLTGTSVNAAILAPDITTNVDGCMEVCFVSYDSGSPAGGTAPSGWTRRMDGSSNNFYGAERAQATHGATGTTDFSADGNTVAGNIAIHLAIAPPASAGTQPKTGSLLLMYR